MKKISIVTIFLLLNVFSAQNVSACGSTTLADWGTKDDLIYFSNRIYVVEAYIDANSHWETDFKILQVIKGTASPVNGYSNGGWHKDYLESLEQPENSETDFNSHTDEKFWNDMGGRMMPGQAGMGSLCWRYFTFKEGEKYLLFPDGTGHVKAAEIIRSENDAWLKYVREKVATKER